MSNVRLLNSDLIRCTRRLGLTLRHGTVNANRRLLHSESPRPDESVKLSDEQQRALDLALKGHSVAIIGAGGTGKTFVLRKIIEQLRANNRTVAVTASSSLAASGIGGTTLHCFANASTERKLMKLFVQNWQKTDYAKKWRQTQVLVIDNISMIEASYLTALDYVTRKVRKQQKPFGAIQVIVGGDFFQLGPDPAVHAIPPFAFEAPEWNLAFSLNQVELTRSFQHSQPELVNLLSEVRLGQISDSTVDLLRSLERPIDTKDGILPVELFPLQVYTDRVNSKRMGALKGDSVVFKARDEVKNLANEIIKHLPTVEIYRGLSDEIVPRALELKVGAQVICIQDIIPGEITNGSLGVITDFLTFQEAQRTKPPTRVPNLAHFDVKKHLVKWPVVRFENGERVLVTPAEFKLQENIVEGMNMTRIQVPLMLGWAMTIDKTQTRSFSRVKIDLDGKFAPGLAYTALSRCKSLEGLQVLNYSPGTINANEKVVAWHEKWKKQWARSKSHAPGDREQDAGTVQTGAPN